MPTSTVPFEVLFEFTNDTINPATIQLARGDNEFSGDATILLQRGESVSLVLNAGSTYNYLLKQRSRKARISVKTWQDVQCTAAGVFAGRCGNGYRSWTPIEGVTITCLQGEARREEAFDF
ncbi:hypothetical protein Hypma_015445 [Hypsizygus marmoreus]|uniref:Uncharacterized protein n=1 Tax=Hypsizygus marmoreus TaxID=39966 RepID=A0A369K1U3_HYPMA|nr:hypothetical protein Hypma_015445 [Hypsizygus marmoreus]